MRQHLARRSPWAVPGIMRRKTKPTGLAPAESKWTGRLSRANIPLETIESRDTDARRSKPFAKSSGTQFLAGPEGIEVCFRIEVERRRSPGGEIEEQLLFSCARGHQKQRGLG
jgi:hypothetical protein